ncbi:MAG TPA: hypothetical protein VF755_18940 [Catenuloplanes sp.]|jgi:hypothetical protein
MDVVDIIAAVATCLALALAAYQYLETRRVRTTERERIAFQRERLRTALAATVVGAETADLIVQKGKQDDATIAELQNMARILRGNLAVIARQLQGSEQMLQGWEVGRLSMMSEPPRNPQLPGGAPDTP